MKKLLAILLALMMVLVSVAALAADGDPVTNPDGDNNNQDAGAEPAYKKLIDNNKKMAPAEEDSLREMINTGAFPQAGNFELFTVDGSKVFVWFEPYSVAPYSYGIQKVQVK